jgi:hypothetical protein
VASDVHVGLHAPTGNYTKILTDADGRPYVLLAGGSAGDSTSDNPTTGDTIHENSSVGVAASAVPVVAGGVITQALVECPAGQANNLLVSFDGGTNFKTLQTGSSIVWTPRGGLTQIYVKASAGTVNYEIILNRNDP